MGFLRPVFLAALAVVMLGSAVSAPCAWRSWRLHLAGCDPAARADARLEESFIALARQREVAVDPGLEARVAALRAKEPERALGDFAKGFVGGERASLPALIGGATSDLVGYGDLRDLWREGEKVARGGTADELTVGFAAAGLALSAATWTSIGAALPERIGLSALKIAQKTGRLSRALTASLARLAAKALDRDAFRAMLAAISRANVGAARVAAEGVLRPAALEGLQAVGRDAGEIYAKAGVGGLNDALALAQSEGELRQAARLAAKEGVKTRAILTLLGRSALIVTSVAATTAFWTLALLAQLVALAAITQRLEHVTEKCEAVFRSGHALTS